jgi:hypothetical protein
MSLKIVNLLDQVTQRCLWLLRTPKKSDKKKENRAAEGSTNRKRIFFIFIFQIIFWRPTAARLST